MSRMNFGKQNHHILENNGITFTIAEGEFNFQVLLMTLCIFHTLQGNDILQELMDRLKTVAVF